MAVFHAKPGRGRITELVLHDGREVWARAEKGVLEIEGDAVERFRKIAHLYGYAEQDDAPVVEPEPQPEPAVPVAAVPAPPVKK